MANITTVNVHVIYLGTYPLSTYNLSSNDCVWSASTRAVDRITVVEAVAKTVVEAVAKTVVEAVAKTVVEAVAKTVAVGNCLLVSSRT